VTADDESAGFVHFVLSPTKNLSENRDRELARRKADDVERRERLTPHRVDVGEGVRRRDLAEAVRVVDDGREKVDGLHEREIVRQHEDPRVVEGLAADDQPRIRLDGESAECSRQVTRTQLGSSAGASREGCQLEQLLACVRRV